MPVPQLQEPHSSEHHDGRFRTWTVDHIPFDELPEHEPGLRSPATVSIDGWQLNWHGDALYVYHPETDAYHELHGQRGYPTAKDAERAWYDAGVLGLMVYEDVAADYGLPSSLAWVQSTANIMTTDGGHDERKVTDARTIEWSRILDPARDLAADIWSVAGDQPLCATFMVSAYGANSPDRFAADDATVEYIEVEYGMVVTIADDDDTEVFSSYAYETVAGATDASPEALDGYMVADMQATFQNLGGGDAMADCVWNAVIDDAARWLG